MAAFVSRYARAFPEVVTDPKLDARLDRQFYDFLATWHGSASSTNLSNLHPTGRRVEILDS